MNAVICMLLEFKTLCGDMCVAGNVREDLTHLNEVIINQQTADRPILHVFPAMLSTVARLL